MKHPWRLFVAILLMTVVATVLALPPLQWWPVTIDNRTVQLPIGLPEREWQVAGKTFRLPLPLKMGLDIQGGMQVGLRAEMAQIPEADRAAALESTREVMLRRVDLFGIAEPTVQAVRQGDDYRLLVELAGVTDSQQALQLVGKTAQLDFRLQTASPSAQASDSANLVALFNSFESSGLTGKELKRAQVQFDPQTGEPVISLEFNETGRALFADLTTRHVGQVLAIFLDDSPVALPVISTPIVDGRAVMTGGFSLDEAKQLAVQLNAGALPVPITVLEQRNIGASLGQQAMSASWRAGVVGVVLVMIFMILIYGWQGLLADLALLVYGILTLAVYKVMGVTLTIPGIAGLLLSIGMAVDSNILIFERMKEELRRGKAFHQAMELGFGRAWDSIKDANTATIMTALILINPLDFSFLNTSGLVRGFGMTLLIGVVISLFTGIVVTRTLMRLFLKGSHD